MCFNWVTPLWLRITAIAFCGAVYFRDKRLWLLPFAGLCLTDLYINWFYAREYGYDARFEADVADIAASILRSPDPERERGWTAELDGRRAGSVFVVRKSPTVAQLRLLVLRPEARGLGLGGRLVDECIAFARARGYRRMVLKTHAELAAARAIYAGRGFRCVQREALAAYGHPLTSETWELRL